MSTLPDKMFSQLLEHLLHHYHLLQPCITFLKAHLMDVDSDYACVASVVDTLQLPASGKGRANAFQLSLTLFSCAAGHDGSHEAMEPE